MTWRSLPDIPEPEASPGYARIIAAVVVPGLLVGLLLWWGHIVAAVILGVLAFSVLAASAASRRVRDRIEVIAGAIGQWAGRILTVVVLGGVYFFVVTPGALVLRLLRRDPLQVEGEQPENTFWFKRPRSVDPLPERMFSVERTRSNVPNRGGVHQGRRVVRLAFVVSTVVALAAVDLAAGTAWDLLRPSSAVTADPRPSLPAHHSDAWAVGHYNSRRTTRVDYAPFVGFVRHQDIHLDQFNITQGVRSSYQPEAAAGSGLPVLYFFGGSTMFGTSQRDLYTIPSFVARLAEADGYPVEVRNYGHESYQSRQEVTLLQQLLAAGHRPDAVVFYDGHNDVDQQARVINTEPSHSQASRLQAMVDDNRASAGAGLPGVWADARTVADVLKRRSATLRLARNLKQRLLGPHRPTSAGFRIGSQRPLEDIAQRAKNAASIYAGSVDIAQHLGEAYGFDVAFFWQPNIFTKTIVAGEESLDDPNQCWHCEWDLQDNRALYLQATELIGPPVIDISDALNDVAEPVMTDQVHTNERGAEAVAERIYSDIKPMIVDAYRDRG
ncbi:MAG: hypothetical protein ACPGVG_11420 [Mycobacterium sp.]